MKTISSDIITVKRRWASSSQRLSVFSWLLGGKLIFLDLGPLELRTHSILVSDGGELRIGSEDKPFQGKARIKLYGSSYSARFFPYGVKFLAVRNGTLSLHGEWGNWPEEQRNWGRALSSQGTDNGENGKTTYISLAVSCWSNKVN